MNLRPTPSACQTGSGSDPLLRLLAYTLPANRIATTPAEPRDSARLLWIDRKSQTWKDTRVAELPKILERGDLLVLNNSKVIPARLICSQNRTELLLLEETSPGWWTALGTPAKRLAPGTDLFPDPRNGPPPDRPLLRVEKTSPGGQLVIRCLGEKWDLDAFGRPPLPPLHPQDAQGPRPPRFQPCGHRRLPNHLRKNSWIRGCPYRWASFHPGAFISTQPRVCHPSCRARHFPPC